MEYVAKSGRKCKRHPSEWGAKNSAAQKQRWEHREPRPCLVCGNDFPAKLATQKYCSNSCRWKAYKTLDGVHSGKALTLGGAIRLGPNKRKIITSMLDATVGKPCKYCRDIVTLASASVDHIVPVASLRGTGLGKSTLDTPENLQIICRRCNRGKGNLSARGFQKLIDFLRTDPEISTYVWRRIAGGGVQFQAWRYNQKRRKMA